MNEGKQHVLSAFANCLRQLKCERVIDRRKQAEKLKTFLENHDIQHCLNQNTILRGRRRESDQLSGLTWTKVFKCIQEYISNEAERLSLRESSAEASTPAVTSNRNKEKKFCCDLFKIFLKVINSNHQHNLCGIILEHMLAVLTDNFTLLAFGLDYTNILLKEILTEPYMCMEIACKIYESLMWIYCKLVQSPPTGWNRSLLTQVLHYIVLNGFKQYDLQPQPLFKFFISVFNTMRNEKASTHHEYLLQSLLIVCKNLSSDCVLQLHHLGESIIVPFIQLWKTKPSDIIKDLMLEFLIMQLAIHHPGGITLEKDSSFANDLEIWKDLLVKLYRLVITELNDVCGKNKYSTGKDLILRPSFIIFAVEVCNQVFCEKNISISLTPLTIPEQPSSASKKRKLEVGFKVFIDAFHYFSTSAEIIPWLQLLSALLGKYPCRASCEEIYSILDLLIQTNLSCNKLEVKTWLLTVCHSAVKAYCYLKKEMGLLNVKETHCDWMRLWELGVKSVSLMHQCHGPGHQLLSVMINDKLTFPKSDFLKLYTLGSNNRLSSSSLYTLIMYLGKFPLPSALSLYPRVKLGSYQNEKYWFQFQILDWMFMSENEQDSSHVMNELLSENFDSRLSEMLSAILICLSVQDCRDFIQNYIVNCKIREQQHFSWIRSLELELLQVTFNFPVKYSSEEQKVSNAIENFNLKFAMPIWNKIVEEILNVSAGLMDYLTTANLLNPFMLLKQVFLIWQILKHLYSQELLNENGMQRSPLAISLKNLFETVGEILTGRDFRGIKGISIVERRKWLLNILPLLLDMLTPCCLERNKNHENFLLQWISSCFPSVLINILVDLVKLNPGPSFLEVKAGHLKIQNVSQSETLTYSDDSNEEVFIDDDFPKKLSRKRNPYSPSVHASCNASTSVTKGPYCGTSEFLDECTKLQKMSIEILGRLCKYCISTESEDGNISPKYMINELLCSAKAKRSSKSHEDIEMIFEILKSVLVTEQLKPEDMNCVLEILRELLNVHKNCQTVWVASISVLSIFLSYHFTCKVYSEYSQKNRDHAMHLLHVLWTKEVQQKCNKHVSVALAEALYILIKHEANICWPSPMQKVTGADDQHSEGKKFSESFIQLLKNRHLRVRIFAATNSEFLFSDASNMLFPFPIQKRNFENAVMNSMSNLTVQNSEDSKETIDEKRCRISTFLHFLCNAILHSAQCEKHALLLVFQFVKDEGASVTAVAKALRQTAILLGHDNLQSFVELHITYILQWWIDSKYNIFEFPFALLEFDILEEFLLNHRKILVPLLMYHLDIDSVHLVANKLKVESKLLLVECVPTMLATMFTWYVRDVESEKAKAFHQFLQEKIPNEMLMSSLLERLDETVFCLLMKVVECPELSNSNEEGKKVSPAFPCGLYSISPSEFVTTLDFIRLKADYVDPFIKMLCQKPDHLQNIILFLHIELSKFHRACEQRQIIFRYHVFVELLLVDFKKGLENCYLFMLRELVYTTVNFFLNNRKRIKDIEENLIFCLELLFKICEEAVPHYHRDIGDLLPFIVSRLTPFVDESKTGLKVLALLEFLIVSSSGHLKQYISFLDCFPDLPIFQNIREKHKEITCDLLFSLKEEIDRFLLSYKMTDRGTLEGIKQLHNQLRNRKDELLVLLLDLQGKILFSEDTVTSSVHQLVCVLAHMCIPGNEPPEYLQRSGRLSFAKKGWIKDKIQKIASQCLGEIGPVAFSSTVLQTSQHTVQFTSCSKKCTSGSQELYKGYSIAINFLCDFMKQNRIEIKVIASNVLKDIFATRTGKEFSNFYQRNCDESMYRYLYPFYQAKSKSLQNLPPTFEYELLNKESLWSPENFTHSQWITSLVCNIIESGCTKNEFFCCLKPICEKAPDLCAALLPYIIHSMLIYEEKRLYMILSNQISLFFAKLSKSLDIISSADSASFSSNECVLPPVGGCKASVQVMLSVVHHLRLQSRSREKCINALERNSWLDLDYLHIGQAAEYCCAHFTALMYTEFWCDAVREKSRNDSKEYCSSSNSSESIGEVISPLAVINSQDPEKSVHVYRTLFNAYNSIGDPDGVHGCSVISTDIDAVILNHYMMQKQWHSLLSIYDINNSSSGIFQALKGCGLDNILQRYLQYHLLTVDEPTLEMVELQFENSWRMAQWDVPVLECEQSGFQKWLFKSLQAVRSENYPDLVRNLNMACSVECENLKHASLESARSIFQALSHFQMIVLIEDFANLPKNSSDLRTVFTKWEKQMKVPFNDYEFVEPVSWLKCTLLQQQLDIHPYRNVIAREFIKSLENHCITGRNENHLHAATQAVMQLKSSLLGSTDEVLKWKVEEAKILWTKNEHLLANRVLKSILSNMEERLQDNLEVSPCYAEALILKGRWSEEICSENANTVMDDYLEKAISVLKDVNNMSSECCKIVRDAYLALARYADSRYQSIENYKKSTTFQTKQELMQHTKGEIKKLMTKRDLSEDQKRTIMIMTKQHKIDEDEILSLNSNQLQFLSKAILNYLKCLQGTDTHDLWVFRLIALWFHNLNNKDINDLIKESIIHVETYKFLPLMYQLAARMGEKSQVHFSNILEMLIKKISLDHPYHALPVILSLSNNDKDPTVGLRQSKERTSKTAINLSRKERTAAAKQIIDDLCKTPLRNVLFNMQILCDAYIALAYSSTRTKEISKQGSTLPIPLSQLAMNMENIPVMTEEMQVDRSCEYKNITGIHCFMPDYRLCGGITVPKVIKCVGTDGKIREQLVKGRDDLRQDAVMQQVFYLVNFLFKKNIETKRRNLQIRTYKVVPMSRRSGIIQWCEGTEVLSHYLIGQAGGAHKKYYPEFWSQKQCQIEMKNICSFSSLKKKREIFDRICRNFPPVFRYFFMENFPEPAAWFERRQSYTRSTATSSIVGYILGLGDRHVNNILIDKHTAEVVHIDFGIAFEKGRVLLTPETVPFRLTRDIVDGMGICGVEGVFKRCCEKTLEVLRNSQDVLLTILEVLLYDPLYDWTIPTTASPVQRLDETDDELDLFPFGNSTQNNLKEVNKLAERALMRLQRKLIGAEEEITLSVSGQVNLLIQKARDPDNLCRVYHGWQPYL